MGVSLLVLREAAGWPEMPLTAQGLGQLVGRVLAVSACLRLCTLLPQRALSQTNSLFLWNIFKVETGPPLALLAITDLQFTLLKEQGLGTEFTLNGAEGVSLLSVKRNLFYSSFWLFNCLAHFQLIWMKVIIFYLESRRAGHQFSSARCSVCPPSIWTSLPLSSFWASWKLFCYVPAVPRLQKPRRPCSQNLL